MATIDSTLQDKARGSASDSEIEYSINFGHKQQPEPFPIHSDTPEEVDPHCSHGIVFHWQHH